MKSIKNSSSNKMLRKAISINMSVIYSIIREVSDTMPDDTPDAQDFEDYEEPLEMYNWADR